MTPADISAALAPYGARLDEADRVYRAGRTLPVCLVVKRGRLRAETVDGRLLFSGPAHAAAVESFVEGFWYWTKRAEVSPVTE